MLQVFCVNIKIKHVQYGFYVWNFEEVPVLMIYLTLFFSTSKTSFGILFSTNLSLFLVFWTCIKWTKQCYGVLGLLLLVSFNFSLNCVLTDSNMWVMILIAASLLVITLKYCFYACHILMFYVVFLVMLLTVDNKLATW